MHSQGKQFHGSIAYKTNIRFGLDLAEYQLGSFSLGLSHELPPSLFKFFGRNGQKKTRFSS